MTEQPYPRAVLRRLAHHPGESALHPLAPEMIVMLGRDPVHCQVVFDSQRYGEVSRQHAQICPVPSASGEVDWELHDLNSANGTYVNGNRIVEACLLKPGDRIMLGYNGPQLSFEMQYASNSALNLPQFPSAEPVLSYSSADEFPTQEGGVTPPSMVPIAPLPADPSVESLTFSQLLPIVSTGRELRTKAYLIPGIVTVSFVVLLFVAIGNPPLFNLVLAAYLSGGAYYFIYQLCGKRKPLWLLVSAAMMTIVLLLSPVLPLFILVFRGILPGSLPQDASLSFPVLFIRMFFGAGLMEELLKAIPIFAAYLIGLRLSSPLRNRVGVWEPLDGILLGAASAVGFTLIETLGQYVPNAVNSVELQAVEGLGELVGLQLLIPRILGSVAGHMAYSGYFGYFIGLSVLVPTRRWQILGVGYLSASLLHGLWNSVGMLSIFLLAIVGAISYACLAAAILKARSLSPNRHENFATRIVPPNKP